jgi:hypothetical protein
MIHFFLPYKKFIPKCSLQRIEDIDFDFFYKEGKRLLLLDIDNTLMPYDQTLPPKALVELLEGLQKKGYEIVLVSNNNKARIEPIARAFKLPSVWHATKPLKRGFKKALRLKNKRFTKIQTLVIGDQLMTDVFGANRSGLDVCLVKPLKKKSEKWYTRANRLIEDKMLEKIAKKDPNRYFTLGLDER